MIRYNSLSECSVSTRNNISRYSVSTNTLYKALAVRCTRWPEWPPILVNFCQIDVDLYSSRGGPCTAVSSIVLHNSDDDGQFRCEIPKDGNSPWHRAIHNYTYVIHIWFTFSMGWFTFPQVDLHFHGVICKLHLPKWGQFTFPVAVGMIHMNQTHGMVWWWASLNHPGCSLDILKWFQNLTDTLAQWVEYHMQSQKVAGSIPASVTFPNQPKVRFISRVNNI